MHYPICGSCYSAWDVIYDRGRVGNQWGKHSSPADILHGCKFGGCDPDVWEFIDEETGWPIGVPLGPNSGKPIAYAWRRDAEGGKGHFNVEAEYDDRVFHRRSPEAEASANPPYTATGIRLQKENIAKGAKKKGLSMDDPDIWGDDEDEDEEPVETPAEDDDDIW